MSYLFKGKLCGYLCVDCSEPLSDIIVRLYRHQPNQNVTRLAVANPKDTLAVLDAETLRGKEGSLLAEGRTDAQGAFAIEISERGYEGEAFEVDIYCGTVPHRKVGRRVAEPRQATITTIQPIWGRTDGGFVAGWNYCIPYRFWCYFRSLFDAWVICGHVTQCQTKGAIANVKVTAFDTDWIQDDDLGSAFTDASGHFRIDYTHEDFEKTPFPFISFELSGPDLYFHVEDSGGTVLLQEPSSRGRDRDRENSGPCFCVDLCVDVNPTPPFNNPLFTHVGDFDISGDISSTNGLTNKMVLGHGGPNYGFTGDLKLKGFCPKTSPVGSPDPMQYRFLYTTPTVLTQQPITGGMLTPVVVGTRLIQWDVFGTGLAYTFQDLYIQGSGATPDPTPTPVLPPGTPWGAPPPHIIVPDADGWIAVDQNGLDSGFYGPLLRFVSASVVTGGVAPGNGAGLALTTPEGGMSISIFFEAGPIGQPATFTNNLPNIFINNWTQVSELDLTEFHTVGATACSEITNSLDILYTADHELMASWGLGISSAATIPLPLPVYPSGSAPRGGIGTFHIDVSLWPSCSYLIGLTTRKSLTDGETDDSGATSQLTFCK
ncbi:hypothetical protein [Granulicella sibirica]|uniref:Carboxypeptidase regulatory-like domain-containing protein n=1 Tax=Granulicella sibirica TaxID=2479048 RepID=A0A4Q0T548_9BACT|nr:hypothetical protein [Granulicella sibirica]RXH58865.1 hypothetical protein GRAN_2175 [Granulicella sibirica]